VIAAAGRRRIRAGIVVLAMPALACTSSSELEKVQSQLSEIHFMLLELRKEGVTKAEVESLESALAADVEGLAGSQSDVTRGLEDLANRIRQLESKLDDTTFRLTQLAQQIEATNQELQAVRSATEVARVPPPPPVAAPSDSVADPQSLYETAYDDYTRGSYDLAILGFRQYVESYPETDLADNAVYWIGECYYLQEKFERAIEQFDHMLERYGRSERTASALLKKGFAYLELGRRTEGVTQLEGVTCAYGGTDEARLASRRLSAMGIDVDCESP
jgi:tol-pal system protein YbgF